MKKYQEWIEKNYPTSTIARLQCKKACERMIKEFPELKLQMGLVSVDEPYGLPPTKTEHYWCITKSNEIIDPTAHQYPTHILQYDPVDESRGNPTGKCPNCGNICYNGRYVCSNECEIEYQNYLSRCCSSINSN
jgi:hypothetical protein